MPMSLLHGIERRGLLIVLSSPSGAGKTTLARALIEAIAISRCPSR